MPFKNKGGNAIKDHKTIWFARMTIKKKRKKWGKKSVMFISLDLDENFLRFFCVRPYTIFFFFGKVRKFIEIITEWARKNFYEFQIKLNLPAKWASNFSWKMSYIWSRRWGWQQWQIFVSFLFSLSLIVQWFFVFHFLSLINSFSWVIFLI